jgi:cytoskeleton protein RodZ
MGTETRDHEGVYTAKPDAVCAQSEHCEQIQLSLFDAVSSLAMTTNNHPAGPNSEPAATPEVPAEEANAAASDVLGAPPEEIAEECLGQRLRAAREARGLSCEDAAHRLKLRASVLQALETERYDRIGHGVYLRGYLTKYLQLLNLPVVLADRVLKDHTEVPALVTGGAVSHPRYLFQRYSGSALYLILTGVIIVPAVLLAMRGGFDSNLVHIAPLDTTEVPASIPAVPDHGSDATNTANNAASAPDPAPAVAAVHAETPLIASMTPFPQAGPATTNDIASVTNTSASVGTIPPGQHGLRLTLAESSWVEITTTDGQKLEYGLLAAGSVRTYHSRQAMDVLVGNVNGATIEIDGDAQDLAPYRHANVAHFRLNAGDSTLSRSGG